MSKTQNVVSHIQYDEMRAERPSYFSSLTSQAVAEVGVTSSPLTSHPILSISAIHSTTPGSIGKCFSPITVCGSNASLPLISSVQGQRVDRWPYEEWPSPISLMAGVIRGEGVPSFPLLTTGDTVVTSDTFYWFMVHGSATSNIASIYHTVRQIGPYELFGDVRWSRREGDILHTCPHDLQL